MKIVYLFLLPLMFVKNADAQTPSVPYWSVNFSFTHDFLVDGHLNVNELNTPADTISLSNDLGKTLWSSVAFKINRAFKNNSAFNLSTEYFFISGANKSARNVWFNGALVNSAEGITIDHSRLIRVQACYEKLLSKLDARTRVTVIGGLIYDFLLIRLTGRILNDADSILMHEDFNDQVIPYPQLGGRLEKDFGDHSRIVLEIIGNYIPRFVHTSTRKIESFRYYCLNSSLGYKYSVNKISFGTSISYRFFRTAEDEGKHDFEISLLGINAALEYRF